MRRWISATALGVLAAAAAFGQPYFATETGTIRPDGPRTGTNGDNFFNVEGVTNGINASYGVARWDTTLLRTNLNNAFGAGNWRITAVDLVLTQSNGAFSASGDVRAFYTADDATDIKTTASPLAYPFEDTPGTPDLPVTLADPLVTYTFTVGTTGQQDVYNLYTDGDVGQRLALRDDLTNDAGQKLTLVLEDVSETVAATYRGQTGTPTVNPPELRVTAVPIVGNPPPTADAGPDQTATDLDLSGDEVFPLDGSASHANPPATTITSYAWTVNGAPVGAGATINYTAPLGTTTVLLTVTDNLGGTATDSVDLEVLSGVLITADAGANSTVDAPSCDGTVNVVLNGGNSSYNAGTITNYAWTDEISDAVVSSGPGAAQNAALAVGTHTLRLTITGSGGETATDVRTIDVRPSTVFAGDDFDFLFPGGITIQPPGPFTSPADAFGVLQRFINPNIPFTLLDDTLVTFPGDTIGVVNDKKLDAWFGCNDLNNPDNPSGTGFVEMTFDISGHANVKLAIDLAAMGDFELAGANPDFFNWTASVDGGAPLALFSVVPDESLSQTYRLASGAEFTLNDPMTVGGTVLTNVFQTFVASIPSGNTLVLRMDASQDSDEAFVFDNVLLYECEGGGNPCPCVGDLDGDGDRDISDLAQLLSQFGQTGAPGTLGCADTDGDGDVDIADLAQLLSAFGVPC